MKFSIIQDGTKCVKLSQHSSPFYTYYIYYFSQ